MGSSIKKLAGSIVDWGMQNAEFKAKTNRVQSAKGITRLVNE
jgi:hypothetical protein